MAEPKASHLFEVSWEVCNKVGGIYTVVKSKVPQMMDYYKNYFLIGPYFKEKAALEFEEKRIPEEFSAAVNALASEGLKVHFGEWVMKGSPKVFLVEYDAYLKKKNELKRLLWDSFRLDSLNSPEDFDEPAMWGLAAGRLLEELGKNRKGCVAHFHEWLAGSALLYLKKARSGIKTVFTTHATVLGRTMAGSQIDLYCPAEGNVCAIDLIKPDDESYKYGVQAKHMLEKAAAANAEIFTTISEVTSEEAEKILGRKPDLLLPNGMSEAEMPNLEEIPIRHKQHKEKIKHFIMPYFFPYYSLDLDETLFYFISGRYEFRNKGIDVFIKALGRLNEKLKKGNSKRTIIVFLFIPSNIRSVNVEVLKSKAAFEDIADSVDDELDEMRRRIIYAIMNQEMPSESQLFSEDFTYTMKGNIRTMKKQGSPPLSTHDLVDGENDAMIKAFRENGLENKKSDKVKVILYPSYLSAADGLLDMNYSDAIWGCHLGVFPSSYEPWGYTPMECAAHGVPSITTDVAGFGLYVKKLSKKEPGIYIIKRRNKQDEEVVQQLTDKMHWYATLTKNDRINNKILAEHFVQKLTWKNLVENYIEAHNRAVG